MNRSTLITFARRHLNTKWRHQGREVGKGLDCVGLLYAVATDAGIVTEDIRNYNKRPGSSRLIEQLLRYCDEVPVDAPRLPGDILMVSVFGEDPQHVMLWTGQDTVIHASAAHRKVVEHRIDDETRRGLCKVFRLRGLDG